MIRFKQFLVERSIENQLAWVRQAEQALKNWPVKNSGSSVTYAVPAVVPAGGYNIRFDPTESYPSIPLSGDIDSVAGWYDPRTKDIVMIKQNAYPGLALTPETKASSLLAHEVGHRYQNQATGNMPEMIKRIPNYTFKDEALKKKLEYGHSDIEINSRALDAAREAQTKYLQKLRDTFLGAIETKFDITNPTNVQNLKHGVRGHVMYTTTGDEISRRSMLMHDIKKYLESGTESIKDTNKNWKRFNDTSAKIEIGMRDKISRAMLEVDPDFSKPGSIQQFLDDTAGKNMGEYSRNLLKDKTPTSPVKSPRTVSTPLPGSNSAALNTAANLGAGVGGGLVGEYVIKPAAEKVGFFKAIESGTRAALSNSPDWVAKAADPVLGAARLALDPIGTTSEFLEKQARMSLPTTKAERDRATERFERKDY